MLLVTAIYITPDASVSLALSRLHGTIKTHRQTHCEGAFIVAGDFNQACLKSVLPKFVHYVHCPTTWVCLTTFHCLYSHLTNSLRRRTKAVMKTLKTWPQGALCQLQDCFNSTDWTGIHRNCALLHQEMSW